MASSPVLVAKIVSAVFLTGVAILTARALAPSGRGILVLIITIGSFTSLVGGLGVNVAARIRMVSTTDPIPLDAYLGISTLLVAAQFVLGTLVGSFLLSFAQVQVDYRLALALGLFASAALAQFLVLDALFAFGLTRHAAIVDALGSGLQLVFVASVAAFGIRTPGWFVVALGAGALLQVASNVYALGRLGLPLRPRLSLRTSGRLIKEGYPAVGYGLGQALTFRFDRYLAGVYLSPAAVGVYSIAATGSELVRMAPYAVGQVLFHRAASASASARDERRVNVLVVGGFIGVVVFLGLTAPLIISTLLGSAYSEAVTPFRILLLAECGMCVFVLHSAVAVPRGRLPGIATASILGLGMVTLLDVLLIPRYGLVGAAWASCASYWALAAYAKVFVRPRRAAPGDADPRPDDEMTVDSGNETL